MRKWTTQEKDTLTTKYATNSVEELATIMNRTTMSIYKQAQLLKLQKPPGTFNRPVHTAWRNMIDRCYTHANSGYHNYGGRGIKVCKSWKNDYHAFEKWALTHGYERGLTLERINNNKGYSPSNCKWATKKEQANNTRRNRIIIMFDEEKNISQWIEATGIVSYTTFYRRLKTGWCPVEALLTPAHHKRDDDDIDFDNDLALK